MKGFRLVAGLLLGAAILSGCFDSAPEAEKPPASPVGLYRADTYRVAGFETNAEGEPVPKMERTRQTTIRIRSDHTMTYEWTAGIEPAAPAGRLEATWREATREELAAASPVSSKWWVFERSDPDRRRGPQDRSRTLMWTPGGCWVPAVDFESGRLTDSYWTTRRADD
ncbi:MAG: hypothetical protein U1E39_06495 [Planctomycetota bacterium]